MRGGAMKYAPPAPASAESGYGESWDDTIRRRAAGDYCSVCNSLPGLKRTALPGGMETSAPVRGLRPIPVLRGFTLKTPKPRNSMRSPDSSAFFMDSKTVSTAISALVLVMPVRFTTSLMMSSLIKTASWSRRGTLFIPASVNHMIRLNLFPCQARGTDARARRSRARNSGGPDRHRGRFRRRRDLRAQRPAGSVAGDGHPDRGGAAVLRGHAGAGHRGPAAGTAPGHVRATGASPNGSSPLPRSPALNRRVASGAGARLPGRGSLAYRAARQVPGLLVRTGVRLGPGAAAAGWIRREGGPAGGPGGRTR